MYHKRILCNIFFNSMLVLSGNGKQSKIKETTFKERYLGKYLGQFASNRGLRGVLSLSVKEDKTIDYELKYTCKNTACGVDFLCRELECPPDSIPDKKEVHAVSFRFNLPVRVVKGECYRGEEEATVSYTINDTLKSQPAHLSTNGVIIGKQIQESIQIRLGGEEIVLGIEGKKIERR